MEFVGGFLMYKKFHDYLYVGVDRFNNMHILMPCRKQVIGEQITQMFFANVWANFDLPTSIISKRDSHILGNF